MRKNAVAALLCIFAITLVISSCASTQAQGQWNSTESATTVNNVGSSKNKILRQEITSLSSLKMPDKIFYYYNGKVKVFAKDDAKFKRILELNVQRDQGKTEVRGKLDMLKEVTIMDFVHGNTLEYNYGESGYERIYFFLDKPIDGKYRIAQQDPSAFAAQDYGFLSSPDQLLKYLNS